MKTMSYRTAGVAVAIVFLVLLAPYSARATSINFEGLPDSQPVGDAYAVLGVHFLNSIALTAGFSLNELDYPPHSGVMVVGDNGGPLELVFDAPVLDLSAYFTWGSRLTLTFYSDPNFTNAFASGGPPEVSNLGSSTFLNPPVAGFRSLRIAPNVPDTLTVDDLNFTLESTAPVPEPATATLLGTGLVSILARYRRRSGGRHL